MKTFIISAGFMIVAIPTFAIPPTNGVPSSEAKEWQEVWNTKTGSEWRTKTDATTGETICYNPLTSEIWRNPANGGKAEAVLREEWVDDGVGAAQRQARKLLPSVTLDNGIPVSATSQFTSVYDSTTSSDSRTVSNSVTGQTITFNPQTSELWKNPVTGRWEAVLRESSQANGTGSDQNTQSPFNEARAPARPVGYSRGKPAQDRFAAETQRREDQRRKAAEAQRRAAKSRPVADWDEPDHRFYNGNYLPGTGDPGSASNPQTPTDNSNFTIPQLQILKPAFAPALAPRPAAPASQTKPGSPGFGPG